MLLSAQLPELASETEALVSRFVTSIGTLETVNLEESQPHHDVLAHAAIARGVCTDSRRQR